MQITETSYPGANNVLREIRRRMVGRVAPLLVALDGRSGTGKSTLAALLAERLGATVVEGDDFYPGGSDAEWGARSAAEKAALVIDWRRLRADTLEPLLAGRPAAWHPFDFQAGRGLAAHTVTRDPAPVIVLDGVYSARPELADLVDLAILVEAADDSVRRQRLLAREGAPFMAAWHRRWDEAEDYYFTHVRTRSSFDMVVTSL
jgi:uridine kinase